MRLARLVDAGGFWPYRYELDVVWRDLDAAGHVNNAVYVTYMESARTACYLAMRGARGHAELDIILARVAVDFRSAASMGERLVVEILPARVGESSFGLTYRIVEKASGRLVCEGESVQVAYDYAKQQKKPLDANLRAKLRATDGASRAPA